jgi:hypothetical protein
VEHYAAYLKATMRDDRQYCELAESLKRKPPVRQRQLRATKTASAARPREVPFNGGFHDVAVNGRSRDEITYHVMLLDEAAFIEAEDLTTMDGVCWKPKRLTYTGHEFIDAARSDTSSCVYKRYATRLAS